MSNNDNKEIMQKSAQAEEAVENTKETKKKGGLMAALAQVVKFGIVGFINTIVSFAVNTGVLILFNKCFGIPEDDARSYLTAQTLAFIISVFNAFLLQNKYVFTKNEGETRKWWQVLIKTYISYAFTGLFLNAVLLWVWNDVIHIGNHLVWLSDFINKCGIEMTSDRIVSYIAQFLNMIITIPLNFIINKFWAYRGKKEKTGEGEVNG